MKIRPVGAELFHANGRTKHKDIHDKANGLIFAIVRKRLQMQTQNAFVTVGIFRYPPPLIYTFAAHLARSYTIPATAPLAKLLS